jgi:hypothetical protein
LTDRIGPYALATRLIEGHGFELWRATDGDDRSCLVQSIALSASDCDFAADENSTHDGVADDIELSTGQLRQKQIAKLTARTLSYQTAPTVQAHGGMTDEDGNRRLYWGMEAIESDPIGSSPAHEVFGDAKQWLEGIRSLLTHIQAAHDEGYCLGHLTTAWLTRPKAEEPMGCLGLNIFIDPDWLLEGCFSAHFAPEEEKPKTCLPSGDLWRLGKSFEPLLHADWPECLREIAKDLTEERVDDRNCDFGYWKARLNDAEAALTLESTDIVDIPEVRPPVETSTKDERPRDPTNDPDEEPDEDLAPRVGEGDDAADQELPSAVPQTEIPEDESSTGNTDMPGSRSDPSEASTANAACLELICDEPPTYELETTPETRLDPEAAVWAAPELPAGASPWSEVVSARGTRQKHSPSDFPGFEEELPDSLDSVTEADTSASEAEISDGDDSSDDSDPDLDFVVSGFSARKIAVGAVALLLIFGFFLLILRPSSREKVDNNQRWSVSKLNVVVIESTPRGASILAERDGSQLGQTPQKFLSTREAHASLLLWAPGYEAQSIVIPERGKIHVSLNPLPPGARCEVRLKCATNCQFEGIDKDLGSPPKFKIDGSAIVRATRGEAVEGARIVRCPSLGGSPARVLNFKPKSKVQNVRVTSPRRAILYVNGSKQGTIPTIVQSADAFVRLTAETRVRSDGWWVPVQEGAEVQLPTPPSAPNVKLNGNRPTFTDRQKDKTP